MLRRRLDEAAARPATIGADPAVTLPSFPEDVGVHLVEAPIVVVHAEGTKVDGAPAGMTELGELMAAKRDLWRSFHDTDEPPGGFVAVMEVSAEVEAATLRPVVMELVAKGYAPNLMVRVPDWPTIPTAPPSWVTTLFAQWEDGTSDGPSYRQALERASASCGDVMRVLTADYEIGERIARSYAKVPAAISSCECDLDVDALEALLVRWAVGKGHRYRMLPLPHHVGAPPLAVSGDSTVDALARRLAKRPDLRTPLELVVE
jgi:hypothetical protein